MTPRAFGLLGLLAVLLVAYASGAKANNCAYPSNYGDAVCAPLITAALDALKTPGGAKSASSSNSGAAAGAVSGSVSQSGSAASVSGINATSAGGSGGNSSTTVDTFTEAARIPVATAFAAALTSAPCGVGSTSGGAQTPLLGLTFGTTRRNREAEQWCHKFDEARVAWMISPVVGCHLAMQLWPDIASAMTGAGITCEQVFAPHPAGAGPNTYTQDQVNEIVRKAVRK